MHKPHDRGEEDVHLLRQEQGFLGYLHKLLKGEHVLGLTNVCFEKDRPCAACQAGKQVGSTHHSKNVMTASRPLELLHIITWTSLDPLPTLASGEVSMVL
jgi:hypothetical protein